MRVVSLSVSLPLAIVIADKTAIAKFLGLTFSVLFGISPCLHDSYPHLAMRMPQSRHHSASIEIL